MHFNFLKEKLTDFFFQLSLMTTNSKTDRDSTKIIRYCKVKEVFAQL